MNTHKPTAVFVLPSLNGGGAERAVLNLHHHCQLDTRIIVECMEGDLLNDPMAHDALMLGTTPGARRHVRIRALARTLRKLRPAVVVAALSPLTSSLAAHGAGARTIFWLQNPPNFLPKTSEGLSTVPGRLGLRTLAGLADAIAGATPGLCSEWAHMGVVHGKLTVLPNGLELPARPFRRDTPKNSSTLQLLSVGRLAAQKRHDLLIRALARIRQQCPAELTILGRGEKEHELRALASLLGVAEHVYFPGFVEDTSPYLRAADIFVLASDYEGFGNVIVEALGSGLPVVCTDAPYGPRFIAGGCRAVTLVSRGDVSALAHAVLDATENYFPELGEEAYARANDFSINRVCTHFESLIECVIAGYPLPAWRDGPVHSQASCE